MRQINREGLEIIKRFEGLEDGDSTTANIDPYVCPAGVWTIGWGHAISYNGRHLRASNSSDKAIADSLYPGGITLGQAESLLVSDTTNFALQIQNTVSVPLTDNQFSALVSFVFNVGIGNFMSSTMYRKLNSGDYLGAAQEFPKWRRAGGKILRGLVLRREAEQDLFLKKN